MSDEQFRLIELRAENFKRLKVVRINPEGRLVRIEGRNGQGKSSALDAFMFAVGGMKNAPEQPVRRGTKKANVSVVLGDLVIERSVTEKGSMSLVVKLKNEQQASPQKVLDRMYSDLTFDPIAFKRMRPQDQADLLRRMVGIDVTELDRKRQEIYEERRIIGRQRDEAKPSGERPGPSVPKEEVSVSQLISERDTALEKNRERADLLTDAERHKNDADVGRRTVAELQERLDNLQKAIKESESASAESTKKALAISATDLAPLDKRIAEAEEVNATVRSAHQYRERESRHKELSDQYDKASRSIEAIDEQKLSMLVEAKYPYDGLTIGTDGTVLLKGVPFSQASSSEQLRASVAIGLAEKKPIRVMLVREGSLLDAASLDELNSIAEEYDADILCERVADSASPSGVLIEDGEVVEP